MLYQTFGLMRAVTVMVMLNIVIFEMGLKFATANILHRGRTVRAACHSTATVCGKQAMVRMPTLVKVRLNL